MEDTWNSVSTEINVWLEKLTHGVLEDPVFEGIVREFLKYDHTLQEVFNGVDKFMLGIEAVCGGLMHLSDALVTGFTKGTDELISADSCKFREATNAITRADAPHSAVAKLRRDLDFNVTGPLKQHLANNKNLKIQLENRKRKLLELQAAKKSFQQVSSNKNLRRQDKRYLQAESNLESARLAFTEIDRQVFEWLHILDEYKGDIYDSTLQTLKYLQYEFFAASAHAVNHVLPARMEFRPMIEMTPQQLEPQVELELQEGGEDDGDATMKILEKWEKDGAFADVADSSVPVDALSLSALLAQGFDEGPARKALRMHNNDTQAALDWLLDGQHEEKKKIPADAVRLPSTLKRVQKMKERRRKEREERERRAREREEAEGEIERRERRRASRRRDRDRDRDRDREREGDMSERNRSDRDHDDESSTGSHSGRSRRHGAKAAQETSLIDFDTEEVGGKKPLGPSGDLLGLDEQPPAPVDFKEPFDVTPLPDAMGSFDPNQCTLSKNFGSGVSGVAPVPALPAPPSSQFTMQHPGGGMGAGMQTPGSMPAMHMNMSMGFPNMNINVMQPPNAPGYAHIQPNAGGVPNMGGLSFPAGGQQQQHQQQRAMSLQNPSMSGGAVPWQPHSHQPSPTGSGSPQTLGPQGMSAPMTPYMSCAPSSAASPQQKGAGGQQLEDLFASMSMTVGGGTQQQQQHQQQMMSPPGVQDMNLRTIGGMSSSSGGGSDPGMNGLGMGDISGRSNSPPGGGGSGNLLNLSPASGSGSTGPMNLLGQAQGVAAKDDDTPPGGMNFPTGASGVSSSGLSSTEGTTAPLTQPPA